MENNSGWTEKRGATLSVYVSFWMQWASNLLEQDSTEFTPDELDFIEKGGDKEVDGELMREAQECASQMIGELANIIAYRTAKVIANSGEDVDMVALSKELLSSMIDPNDFLITKGDSDHGPSTP
jgi:hypothetical protein